MITFGENSHLSIQLQEGIFHGELMHSERGDPSIRTTGLRRTMVTMPWSRYDWG